jgi:hypothetical protein
VLSKAICNGQPTQRRTAQAALSHSDALSFGECSGNEALLLGMIFSHWLTRAHATT